jgi:hypothetical protein
MKNSVKGGGNEVTQMLGAFALAISSFLVGRYWQSSPAPVAVPAAPAAVEAKPSDKSCENCGKPVARKRKKAS